MIYQTVTSLAYVFVPLDFRPQKRVFLVILFTSFSGSLVSRISGAIHITLVGSKNSSTISAL
ncbi:hypothetical protein CFI09_25650 (plasmid) [Escherichia coli]|nr:hypothetical protein CFI09_25650 [Escherichia coli]